MTGSVSVRIKDSKTPRLRMMVRGGEGEGGGGGRTSGLLFKRHQGRVQSF